MTRVCNAVVYKLTLHANVLIVFNVVIIENYVKAPSFLDLSFLSFRCAVPGMKLSCNAGARWRCAGEVVAEPVPLPESLVKYLVFM